MGVETWLGVSVPLAVPERESVISWLAVPVLLGVKCWLAVGDCTCDDVELPETVAALLPVLLMVIVKLGVIDWLGVARCDGDAV